MKLYFNPGACSLSPHIVLRELGIDVQLDKVDLKAKKTEDGGDFLKINPKGYVPALQLDNGEILTEGPAIVQYLADQKPASKLAPANGTLERVRVQEWLNFITSELHKAFSPLFDPSLPADTRKTIVERLNKRFDYVNRALEGKTWITGDAFTVVDAYLFVVLSWAKYAHVDLGAYRNVLDYLKRVTARPAVQRALEAEGLLKKAA